MVLLLKRKAVGSNPAGEAKKPRNSKFFGLSLCGIIPNATFLPHFVLEGLFLVNAFTANHLSKVQV